MSREYLPSPPASEKNDNGDTTFQSVRSDSTFEDYYFETRSDLLGTSPRNSASSPLEYSDESEVDATYHRRAVSSGMNPKSRFRSRPPESLLDNVSAMFQQQQQQQQSLPSKNSTLPPSTRQFPSNDPIIIQPKYSSIQSSINDEEMQNNLARNSHTGRGRNTAPFPSSGDPNPDPSEETLRKGNWMVRLAYSFRSSPSSAAHSKSEPSTTTTTTTSTNNKKGHYHHRRQDSDLLEEYPHSMGGDRTTGSYHHPRPPSTGTVVPPPIPSFESWANASPNVAAISRESSINEDSPLIGATYSLKRYSSSSINDDRSSEFGFGKRKDGSTTQHHYVGNQMAAKVAAAFLQDYEANRPPTFGDTTTLDGIREYQMTLFHIKHSVFAEVCRFLAVLAFFASSFLEGFYAIKEVPAYRCYLLTALNGFGIFVALIDIWIRKEFRGHRRAQNKQRNIQLRSISASTKTLVEKHDVRVSRSEKLMQPLIFFCALLALENIFRVYIIRSGNLVLFSSICKPLVLFYVSSQARDAFEAVRRIIRIVVRVLIMEMLLILMFAAIACRLFQRYENFRELGVAWVSLFELATTVVNPSIWMPIYQDSKLSAIFFIFFIVTTVFYLHSLVLSVVFQTYIQAASDIHERNASDKEDAVYLAFLALLNGDQKATTSRTTNTENVYVDIRSVRQTLKILRPHYSSMKINALVEIVDPAGQGAVDYTTFRTKIRQALNASIRTARNASGLAMSVELIAAVVAVTNFIYVLLVSSEFNPQWFATIQVVVGSVITLVAAAELLIRFNPFRIPDFTPLARLNATFDGSAAVAAVVSLVGIISYIYGQSTALEYILMGRALDMIRILRLFPIFRDICRRTSDVLPALMGPLTLVLSTLHVFTYTGMTIWGGAVVVGQHPDRIISLYDLNNFNSYQEGVVTMFQILAVNDWYAIADVFLSATCNSSRYIVYLFFILANLICVSIMLNVLTAFFVESFVTKLHDDKDAPAEATTTIHKERGGLLVAPDVKRTSVRNVENMLKNERDDDSVDTTESERFEFDVYERQGFDKIMQTVAGSAYQGDTARDICKYLEIYESLSPGRDTVGYLVCDQQTLERFGNRRFRTKAIGCLDESKLHSVVTDMHSELLVLAPRPSFQDRSLVRTFPHKREPGKGLEVSAALLRRHPALSLFVSRTINMEKNSK